MGTFGRGFFSLIKGILFVLLLLVLCATAFINGFLSEVVRDLPLIENLGVPDIAMTSKIYASDGTLLGDVFGEENRILVGWHQIPQDMRDAIVAVEDKDFYTHPGFDIRGISRAFYENIISRNPTGQGGSTLTQQLVRNLYLTNEPSYKRKLAEIILAVKIEQKYSKDEILTFYLNQVYFGSNAYGVEAASQTYFGHTVSECDLAECALLAGLPQAPSRLSPYVDLNAAKERRTHVLTRMFEEGYITAQEKAEADAGEITLSGRRSSGFKGLAHPYFCTYVIQKVQDEFGLRRLYTDGLRIYTTVNPEWQAKAEETVTQGVANFQRSRVEQGALVTIEAKTGAIRAMVGGIDFNESEFNRAWQANRQPGSSFKPYVYLTAMLQGYSPESLVRDSPVEFNLPGWGVYRPKDYDRSYRGIITLRSAIAASRNVPAVRIVDIVGAQNVADTAKLCGIETPIRPTLSMGIGASEVTLLEHTSAFATFANDGIHNEPYAIERILDSRGNVIYSHTPDPKRVIEPNPIRLLVSMMQTVVTSGTGTHARISGQNIAGKTGTTDDWRDAWFLGFTPSLVTGVWVGRDDNSAMARVTGGLYPAIIWHDYMTTVLADRPPEQFPRPRYPSVVPAMDKASSQMALSTESEAEQLAKALGVNADDYTLEELRRMAEEAGISTGGEEGNDGTASELPPEGSDTGTGDDSGGTSGGGDGGSGGTSGGTGGDNDEGDDDFVFF
jgi:penicillin-binding protein 1A